MKFGVSTFVTDEGIRPGPLGRALEERGFDALFLAEHSHIPTSRKSPYPGGGELPRVYYRTLDPFVALTAAAAATSGLVLGTGIALLIQRDLFHTAKEVASLDLLSEGRVAFGVGVGWNREEMSDHGTDPRTRGTLMNEQLQALKAIWTQDEAQFHGKHVDFDPIFSWPKPVQRPHPPIYVGGESESARQRLFDHADAWLPRGDTPAEEIRRVRETFAQRRGAQLPVSIFGAGRDEDKITAWADAGVERVTFMLGTHPEEETLRKLDELAAIAQRHR
jgi:probable F420-dependent oxidoreductase